MTKLEQVLASVKAHPAQTSSQVSTDTGLHKVYVNQLLLKLYRNDLISREKRYGSGGAPYYVYSSVVPAKKHKTLDKMTLGEFEFIMDVLDIRVEEAVEVCKEEPDVQQALATMCRKILTSLKAKAIKT